MAHEIQPRTPRVAQHRSSQSLSHGLAWLLLISSLIATLLATLAALNSNAALWA